MHTRFIVVFSTRAISIIMKSGDFIPGIEPRLPQQLLVVRVRLFVNLSFSRLSLPPKGWQNSQTEKAKGPKYPKYSRNEEYHQV